MVSVDVKGQGKGEGGGTKQVNIQQMIGQLQNAHDVMVCCSYSELVNLLVGLFIDHVYLLSRVSGARSNTAWDRRPGWFFEG